MSWPRYAAWLLLCGLAILAADALADQANSALWRTFPIERWEPAGLPYYTIWALILALWAVCHAPGAHPRWRPPAGTWTRQNVAVLVGVIVATEAVYGFKHLPMLEGYPPSFDHVKSAGWALSALVAAPVVEELLFRGYLWHELTVRAPSARSGLVAATLVSSLLFAVWHLPAIFGPYPVRLEEWPPLHAHFVFGVIMAIARWRFGSIGIGAVLHGLWNLL